jgi:hypothetical protein
MRRFFIFITAILLAGGPAAAQERRVVVELFTSQGCSSCPPADAILAELAKRGDMLPLAFHVDYWDYLGWKDPYASRSHSERQRAYARTLGARFVYTPQLVVEGHAHAVGSRRDEVEAMIAKARARQLQRPSIAIDDQNVMITSPTSTSGPGYLVSLAIFESQRSNPVPRGENSGRTLATTNVVRELRPLGRYEGGTAHFTVDRASFPKGCDGAAILVQEPGPGRIIAAELLKPAR